MAELFNPMQFLSPECTHVDDFFTYFFKLDRYKIQSMDRVIQGLDPLHPKYNLIQLISTWVYSGDRNCMGLKSSATDGLTDKLRRGRTSSQCCISQDNL